MLGSWVTYLTAYPLNFGSKEVTGTKFDSFILRAKLICFFHFFLIVVRFHLYKCCKGQLWSWLLSLGIRGLTFWGNCGLIFCMGSGAGWIRLFRHAGMGTYDNS